MMPSAEPANDNPINDASVVSIAEDFQPRWTFTEEDDAHQTGVSSGLVGPNSGAPSENGRKFQHVISADPRCGHDGAI